MTHAPPVPAGNQSPYPLQVPSPAKVMESRAPDTPATIDRPKTVPLVAALFGIGIAAAAALAFARRQPVKPKRAKSKKRKGR